jgi:teichuronic acid biosynthesis glycosyltransferase TuaC
MNLLFFVSSYAHSIFPNRGPFFKIICEGLASNGIQVTVIAPLPYSNKWIEKLIPRLKNYHLLPRKEKRNGVTIYRPRYLPITNKFGFKKIAMNYATRRLIKKIRPDIIDFRNSFPSSPYGDVVMKNSLENQIPYIYTINGEEYPISGARKSDIYYLSQYIKHSVASFAVSSSIISSIHTQTGYNLSLMTHPINLPLNLNYTDNKKDIRSKLHLDPNMRYILFAGAISNQKGVDILLESFRLLGLNDTKLILIGPLDYSSQYSFNDNEIYHGIQNQSVLYDYMKACDMFVFPSRNEGMPNVLKEAGAAGIPIIASNAGGIPDILDNGERGVVVGDTNASSYANAIKHVFDNYDEALMKAKRMQQHIEDKFLIASNTRNLIELYRIIIKEYET